MSFLLPIGLLALLTLPIILILHLIRERRKRVRVPSLLHWLDVPRKQSSERVRRLPLTLLLLLHLLIAGLLGLALARPQLLSGLLWRASQTAIVLDTSTSMAARDGEQTRFEQAQARVRALLRSLAGNDRVALIAAGPTARLVASGGANDLATLEAALDSLQAGGTGADLSGGLVLAEAALDLRHPAQIVVLTDGATPPPPTRTTAAPVDWQTLGSNQPNRAIISFAARPLGAATQLYARVANYDSAPFQTMIRLYDGQRRVDTREVFIAGAGESELTWKLSSSSGQLRAELDGRDGLPEDDQAFLNVASARPVNVLLVTAAPDPLRRALAAVPGVSVTVLDPGSYPSASVAQSRADLTVFDGYLPPAWPDGATLAINPPAGSGLLTVDETANSVASNELIQHGATVAGLSFGGVNFGPVQPITAPQWAKAQLASGAVPLILRGRDGPHEIAIWAFDLVESNLPIRLAFPLLVGRTVRDLAPASLPESVQAGVPVALRPGPRASELRITGPDAQTAQTASAPNLTLDTLTQPGWYQIVEQGSAGPLFEGRLAVNAGSVLESDLRPQSAPAFASSPAWAGGQNQRLTIELWPWLALAALVALGLEWLYIHR